MRGAHLTVARKTRTAAEFGAIQMAWLMSPSAPSRSFVLSLVMQRCASKLQRQMTGIVRVVTYWPGNDCRTVARQKSELSRRLSIVLTLWHHSRPGQRSCSTQTPWLCPVLRLHHPSQALWSLAFSMNRPDVLFLRANCLAFRSAFSRHAGREKTHRGGKALKVSYHP